MRGDRAADGVLLVDRLSVEDREALLDDHGDSGGRRNRCWSWHRRCQHRGTRSSNRSVVRAPRLARIIGHSRAAERRRLGRQSVGLGFDPPGVGLGRIRGWGVAEGRWDLCGLFRRARGKAQQHADHDSARGMATEKSWRPATTRMTHLETPSTQPSNRTDEAPLCRNWVNGWLSGVRMEDAARPYLALAAPGALWRSPVAR